MNWDPPVAKSRGSWFAAIWMEVFVVCVCVLGFELESRLVSLDLDELFKKLHAGVTACEELMVGGWREAGVFYCDSFAWSGVGSVNSIKTPLRPARSTAGLHRFCVTLLSVKKAL